MSELTKIKICGLTRSEDIECVNELMPDYVGFVFAKSKRKISAQAAAKLISYLNSNIKKVGVFVDAPIQNVLETARICALDVIQLHGSEDLDYCRKIEGYEVWKSFGLPDTEDMEGKTDGSADAGCFINYSDIEQYKDFGVLLDTCCKGSFGGTGKRFDWESARGMSKRFFTILAGGITPENVKEAIETVKPHVVDVSSGVETDGHKDCEKIKKLIMNARG